MMLRNEVTLLLEDIKGALQESTQLMESGTQEEDALWLSATRTSVTGSAWQHLALEVNTSRYSRQSSKP